MRLADDGLSMRSHPTCVCVCASTQGRLGGINAHVPRRLHPCSRGSADSRTHVPMAFNRRENHAKELHGLGIKVVAKDTHLLYKKTTLQVGSVVLSSGGDLERSVGC